MLLGGCWLFALNIYRP